MSNLVEIAKLLVKKTEVEQLLVKEPNAFSPIDSSIFYLAKKVVAQDEEISALKEGYRWSWIGCVKEFNTAFNIEAPVSSDDDSITLQRNLVDKKFEELCNGGNDIEFLDAIGDLVYALIGFALKMGYDLDGAFREIHRSNMSKLGADGKPVYSSTGKVTKGPNFTPPNLAPYIEPIDSQERKNDE